MFLLEGYISNFTCASYSFLYVIFSDFYVNQSLAGQTIIVVVNSTCSENINNPNLSVSSYCFVIRFAAPLRRHSSGIRDMKMCCCSLLSR
jgi:hypothetical protein